MARRKRQLKYGPSLGRFLLDALFPARYEPPRNRTPTQLTGWSGLPTDPPQPDDPYAWNSMRDV